ncbi:MAG: hypothetical protein WC969_09820 [Elusimicrobiota bacterium]|jgi:hypothetical protein
MDAAPDLLIAGSSPLAAALFRRAGELGLKALWLDEDPESDDSPLELLLSGGPESLRRDPALCALRAKALDGLIRRHPVLLRRRGLLLPLGRIGAERAWRAYDLLAPLRRSAPGRVLSADEARARLPSRSESAGGGLLRWEEWGLAPGTLARTWAEEGTALGGLRLPGARAREFERARGRIAEVRWSSPDGRGGAARPSVVVNAAGARALSLAERARCRLFGLEVRAEHGLLLRASPGEDAVLLDEREPRLVLVPCEGGSLLGPIAGPPRSREADEAALWTLNRTLPGLGEPGPGAPVELGRARVRGTFLRGHEDDGAANLLTALADDPLLEWAAAERAAAAALRLLGRRPPAATPGAPLWVRALGALPPFPSRVAGRLLDLAARKR